MTQHTTDLVREQAAAVWAETLDGSAPTDSDNFFRTGGTSLKALRLCARLGTALGRQVPVKVLLRNSTFGAFVNALESTEV
ncbi:phosphopantetheine-binding protein [Salinispora arenicola]|uniref:phosphopantetheine-binding protein n=1 Tax=Salinispora arenicola TaxID=168697 RepID=UPI000374C4E4|nr:phosphopantetheine-binding protein [Salinispora arenicola]